jgi:hypothetical protein
MGPLRTVGYLPAWDNRAYLSPVDDHELALVVSRLPPDSELRSRGWFENIAAVFAIDDASYDHFMAQGQGNPFIHHTTMGIVPLDRGASESDLSYALRLVAYMVGVRTRVEQALGAEPGNLILAVPAEVFRDPRMRDRLPELTHGMASKTWRLEPMDGGGFLLQFFVLAGGRVELALRHGTSQAFNAASVEAISIDEISVRRDLLEKGIGGPLR